MWISSAFKWAVMLVCVPMWVETAWPDDQSTKSNQLPSKFEEGIITISGSGGTPGDRSTFKIELSPNGELRVQRGRKKLDGPVHTTKLSEESKQKFYDAMIKVVSEKDPKILNGPVSDGWQIGATIETNGITEYKGYRHVDDLPDISPGFKVISDILEKGSAQR